MLREQPLESETSEARFRSQLRSPVAFASSPGEKILCGALLLYFVAKTLFLALTIREGIFPDETTHFGLVDLFRASILPPADSAQS